MFICPNCGSSAPDTAHFCSFCGQQLQTVPPAAVRAIATMRGAAVRHKSHTAQTLWQIWAVGLAIFIILYAAGLSEPAMTLTATIAGGALTALFWIALIASFIEWLGRHK